jgi:hypothetical protein
MNFGLIPTQSSDQSRLEYYNALAEFTYEYYGDQIASIKTVFPTPVSTIHNWEQYSTGKHSNVGKQIENVITNYCKHKEVFSAGGHDDIIIDMFQVEIKSSKKNIIQSQLQSSFPENNPNKLYCFVTNTSLHDIEVRMISSEILYYLSLGDTISQELAETGNSATLEAQLKEGLSLMDFYPLLDNLIKTGHNLKSTKSFKIGNKIRVRFITQIELL